jgi:CRP/FNR family transcriptional regulator
MSKVSRSVMSTSSRSIRSISAERVEATRPPLLRLYTKLGSLSDADLDRVARASETQLIPAGNTIFRQEDEADAVYLLLDGEISLEHHNGEGRPAMHRVFGPYESFGDLALLDEPRRYFTARASSPSIVIRTPLTLLREVLASNPDLAEAWIHAVSADLERRGHSFKAPAAAVKRPAYTDAA